MSSSSTSITCVVEKCELASLALCQCCKNNLCIDHLNEHANQRNEKLLPFVDKINILLNRFNSFYDGEQSISKQLDQWRQNAYKIIDNFFDRKRQGFVNETTDKQREQLDDVHNKLKELIRKKGGTQEDFDALSEQINSIEQYLDQLQKIQLSLPPLTIDDNCILQPEQQRQTSNNSNKTPERETNSSEKASTKKKSSDKSSKKKKKSSRYSDDSSDRSSRHRSRSPRNHSQRSRRRRSRSRDSNSSHSSNNKRPHCDDCQECRFYQDRFGVGFMDSFGPCSCNCHKWAFPS